MQNQNIIERNELLAQGVIDSLKKRNFEAYYCKNKEDVLTLTSKLIPEKESVSWGGSVTLDELNIKEFLKNKNYNVIDRDSANSKEERKELIIKGMSADTFLMSANAIAQSGEIVNIDGHGNRISALAYGPRQVIIIAGMNKVVKTLDDAISRARNFAAPINAKRVSSFFEINTPCTKSGFCADCKSPTSICAQIMITRLSNPTGRIKVILVNETLGY